MGGPEKSLTWALQAFDQKGSLCRPAKSGNKTEVVRQFLLYTTVWLNLDKIMTDWD